MERNDQSANQLRYRKEAINEPQPPSPSSSSPLLQLLETHNPLNPRMLRLKRILPLLWLVLSPPYSHCIVTKKDLSQYTAVLGWGSVSGVVPQ